MKIAKNLIECCSMYISDIPQLVLPNKKAMSPLFKSVPLRALSTYFKSAVMLKAPSQFCSLGSNFFTNILEELTKSEALSTTLWKNTKISSVWMQYQSVNFFKNSEWFINQGMSDQNDAIYPHVTMYCKTAYLPNTYLPWIFPQQSDTAGRSNVK